MRAAGQGRVRSTTLTYSVICIALMIVRVGVYIRGGVAACGELGTIFRKATQWGRRECSFARLDWKERRVDMAPDNNATLQSRL